MKLLFFACCIKCGRLFYFVISVWMEGGIYPDYNLNRGRIRLLMDRVTFTSLRIPVYVQMSQCCLCDEWDFSVYQNEQ